SISPEGFEPFPMMTIDRRSFIRTAAVATLGAAIAPRGLTQSAAGESKVPLPCAPDAWKKHGIILQATEPWEQTRLQNFTSPAEPLEGGAWRFWYSAG